LIEEIPPQYGKQLTPDDFYLPRLRYVDPAPYTKEEFNRAYNWMLTWTWSGPNAHYEKLVCNRVAAATRHSVCRGRANRHRWQDPTLDHTGR
jgi:hypothetical protein